jgi:hypothetical protein
MGKITCIQKSTGATVWRTGRLPNAATLGSVGTALNKHVDVLLFSFLKFKIPEIRYRSSAHENQQMITPLLKVSETRYRLLVPFFTKV